MLRPKFPIVFVSSLFLAAPAAADETARAPSETSLTLDQAVAVALEGHPRVREATSRQAGAQARTGEARLVVLPELGVSVQLNRSSGNAAPGTFFPTRGFPVVAGPPRGRSLDGGSWQTGASVWADWDVVSLWRQGVSVDLALAGSRLAGSQLHEASLDVAYGAADAFLALLIAHESTVAARASLVRARTFETMVNALVAQNLRPQADASRTNAECALAETAVARAEQREAIAEAALAESIGDVTRHIDASIGKLLAPVTSDAIAGLDGAAANPPAVVTAEARAARAAAEAKAINLQYLPRIDLLAALWARGSGLYDSPGAGLVPDIANWGVGVSVSWNALDLPLVNARSRAADADASAAIAAKDAAVLATTGRLAAARARLRGALAVAAQTPVTLAAARLAESQASARYQSGLGQAFDVADAQRVLAQATADDVVARLEVRRSMLLIAWVRGDLEPFLASVR